MECLGLGGGGGLCVRLGVEGFGHHVVACLEAAVALFFELGWFRHDVGCWMGRHGMAWDVSR